MDLSQAQILLRLIVFMSECHSLCLLSTLLHTILKLLQWLKVFIHLQNGPCVCEYFFVRSSLSVKMHTEISLHLNFFSLYKFYLFSLAHANIFFYSTITWIFFNRTHYKGTLHKYLCCCCSCCASVYKSLLQLVYQV